MKTYGFFSFLEDSSIRGTEELDQTINSVPDMSYSVKEILQRFRRGTLDVGTLIRESPDLNIDLDDDRFDGIDDITDYDRLKRVNDYELQRTLSDIRNSRNLPPDNDRDSDGSGEQHLGETS